MLRRNAATWPVGVALLYVTPLLTSTEALADEGLGTGAGVSCVAGGCEVRAEVHHGHPRGVGVRRSAGSGGERSSRSEGVVSGPPTVTSNGWEYGLGNGLGILPRFDHKETKKPKPKRGQKVPVEVVARRVVERLRLPQPVIRTSPDEGFVQVVGVPTWMWVEHGDWGPVTETAVVPGLRVTATARPRQAVWSMGDGGSVTCMGPGTEYSGAFRPEQPSPDCGYTYRKSSAGEPGRVFTVSVRVMWDVEWHGGGRSGRVPGLVIAAERPLAADEVQAVVVR